VIGLETGGGFLSAAGGTAGVLFDRHGHNPFGECCELMREGDESASRCYGERLSVGIRAVDRTPVGEHALSIPTPLRHLNYIASLSYMVHANDAVATIPASPTNRQRPSCRFVCHVVVSGAQ
jgi:hypothetical protein